MGLLGWSPTIGYILMLNHWFITDGLLRKKDARSFQGFGTGQKTKLFSIHRLGPALGILSAYVIPLLGWVMDSGKLHLQDDTDESTYFVIAMVILMICGLLVRYWSMSTLGEYFTRTLRVQSNQKVITTGPYRVIRHPGYAANFLVSLPACLLIGHNWLATAFEGAVFAFIWRKRILAEEDMMVTELGKEYVDYQSKTSRIIPGIW